MFEKIVCFLPCRKGSERVPRKNIRPFAHYQHGLIEIKISQLLATPEIDQIVLSTDDEEILEFASTFNSSRLVLHHRDSRLAASSTSTDALVGHAHELIEGGHILWTHVTSPFVTAQVYSEIIAKYRTALTDGYDSLMTTTPIHGFLWTDKGPTNYDRDIEKWPRTQTLDPIQEVNSAVFLANRNIYAQLKDRIGGCPYLFEMDKLTAFDIDWQEDFTIAELLANSKLAKT